MSKLKVEGKVGDFCPNCKNCKGATRMLGGDINDVITCREQMKSLLNGEEPMDDE